MCMSLNIWGVTLLILMVRLMNLGIYIQIILSVF